MELDPSSIDWLLDVPLDYSPAGGDLQLREAIASLYDGLTPDDVLATAGAAEAIRAVSMAVVRPGDKVVVQYPSYPALHAAPIALGATVCPWTPRQDFDFDFRDLACLEFAGASAVLLNTPHGPSGAIPHGDYNGRARLIADEVYRPIELVPGTQAPSLVNLYCGAVSIGDLSKPLGLGGLRIGWIASRDRDVLQECQAALDHLSGSVSTLCAPVAVGALRQIDRLIEAQLARARTNLSHLAAFIESHNDRLDWMSPQAGYTAFVRYRGGDPGAAFYDAVREGGVFALRGNVYGEPDYVRIGFGLDVDRFQAALQIFGDEVRRLPTTPSAAPENDVIVLAKEPRPGFTKTRLAAAIGADAAARLSDVFLQRSLELARRQARRLYVSFAPDNAREAFEARAPGARLLSQPKGNLGRRLLSAFETAFADGARRPVLIGSDSPTLPSHLLSVAQRALAKDDVVIGPAEDGGYYLIGMNRPQAALFEGIDWGQNIVLRQTLSRAAEAGLRVATLPYWYDIDTADDLARLEGAL